MKMKQITWLIFGLSLAASPFVRGEEKVEKAEKKSEVKIEKKAEAAKVEEQKVDHDKLSIALGHFFVRNLTKSQSPLKVDKIIDGMKAEMKKKDAPMTQEEFQQAMVALQVEQFKALSEKNLKDATAFLEKNGKEKEVITLDSKLQYKVVKAGEGSEVLSEDSKPLVRVEGKLLDGTVFSANKEGDAIPLYLKETVPGISKGMIGMKKGEKRTVFIHPDLAFGANSPLPPNSLIIFDVEVVEMKSAEPAKTDEAAAPAVSKEENAASPQTEMKKEETSVTAQTEVVKDNKAPVVQAVSSTTEVRKAENVPAVKAVTAQAEVIKAEKATAANAAKEDKTATATADVKKEEKSVTTQTKVTTEKASAIAEVKQEGKKSSEKKAPLSKK